MSAAKAHLSLLSQWAITVDTGAYQTGHSTHLYSIDGMRGEISYIVM